MQIKAFVLFFFCIGPPGPPGASVSNMLVDVFTRVVVRNSSTILQKISEKVSYGSELGFVQKDLNTLPFELNFRFRNGI